MPINNQNPQENIFMNPSTWTTPPPTQSTQPTNTSAPPKENIFMNPKTWTTPPPSNSPIFALEPSQKNIFFDPKTWTTPPSTNGLKQIIDKQFPYNAASREKAEDALSNPFMFPAYATPSGENVQQPVNVVYKGAANAPQDWSEVMHKLSDYDMSQHTTTQNIWHTIKAVGTLATTQIVDLKKLDPNLQAGSVIGTAIGNGLAHVIPQSVLTRLGYSNERQAASAISTITGVVGQGLETGVLSTVSGLTSPLSLLTFGAMGGEGAVQSAIADNLNTADAATQMISEAPELQAGANLLRAGVREEKLIRNADDFKAAESAATDPLNIEDDALVTARKVIPGDTTQDRIAQQRLAQEMRFSKSEEANVPREYTPLDEETAQRIGAMKSQSGKTLKQLITEQEHGEFLTEKLGGKVKASQLVANVERRHGLVGLAENQATRMMEPVLKNMTPSALYRTYKVLRASAWATNAGFSTDQLYGAVKSFPDIETAWTNVEDAKTPTERDTAIASAVGLTANAVMSLFLGVFATAHNVADISTLRDMPENDHVAHVITAGQDKLEHTNLETRDFAKQNHDIQENKTIDMGAQLLGEAGGPDSLKAASTIAKWINQVNLSKLEAPVKSLWLNYLNQAHHILTLRPEDAKTDEDQLALKAKNVIRELQVKYPNEWKEALNSGFAKNKEGAPDFFGTRHIEDIDDAFRGGPAKLGRKQQAQFLKRRRYKTIIDLLTATDDKGNPMGFVPEQDGMVGTRLRYMQSFGNFRAKVASMQRILNEVDDYGMPLGVKEASITNFKKNSFIPLAADETVDPSARQNVRAIVPVPEDLTKANILEYLKNHGKFAMMTADNRNGVEQSPEDNVKQTEQLDEQLRNGEYRHLTGEGHYTDDNGKPLQENSRIIFGMGHDEGRFLSEHHQQKSLVTHRGIYNNETAKLMPIDFDKTIIGPEAEKQAFWTKIHASDGDVSVSFVPHTDEVLPQQKLHFKQPDGLDTAVWNHLNNRNKQAIINAIQKTPTIEETMALAKAGEAGKNWYDTFQPAFQELLGPVKFKPFVGLLASISPRVPVAADLINAMNFWSDLDEHGLIKKLVLDGQELSPEDERLLTELGHKNGISGSNLAKDEPQFVLHTTSLTDGSPLDYKLPPNILRVFRGEDLHGPKVSAFQSNLLGNFKRATLDTWMRFLTDFRNSVNPKTGELKAGSFTPNEYRAFESRIKVASKKLGWTAAQTQAAMWSFVKTLSEIATKNHLPFPNALKHITNPLLRKRAESFLDLIDDAFHNKIEPGDSYSVRHQRQQIREAMTRFGIGERELAAAHRAADLQKENAGDVTSVVDNPTTKNILKRVAARLENKRSLVDKEVALKLGQHNLFEDMPEDEVYPQTENEHSEIASTLAKPQDTLSPRETRIVRKFFAAHGISDHGAAMNLYRQIHNAGFGDTAAYNSLLLAADCARFAGLDVDDYLAQKNIVIQNQLSKTDLAAMKAQGISSDEIRGLTRTALSGKSNLVSTAQHIVTLTQGADASTLIHELTHVFTDEILSGPERDAIIDDLVKRTGVPLVNGQLQTVHKELLAQEMERLWGEGKLNVPPELQPLYQRMAKWITDVYQSLRNLPGVNPILRQKMDTATAAFADNKALTANERERFAVPRFHRVTAQGESLKASMARLKKAGYKVSIYKGHGPLGGNKFSIHRGKILAWYNPQSGHVIDVDPDKNQTHEIVAKALHPTLDSGQGATSAFGRMLNDGWIRVHQEQNGLANLIYQSGPMSDDIKDAIRHDIGQRRLTQTDFGKPLLYPHENVYISAGGKVWNFPVSEPWKLDQAPIGDDLQTQLAPKSRETKEPPVMQRDGWLTKDGDFIANISGDHAETARAAHIAGPRPTKDYNTTVRAAMKNGHVRVVVQGHTFVFELSKTDAKTLNTLQDAIAANATPETHVTFDINGKYMSLDNPTDAIDWLEEQKTGETLFQKAAPGKKKQERNGPHYVEQSRPVVLYKGGLYKSVGDYVKAENSLLRFPTYKGENADGTPRFEYESIRLNPRVAKRIDKAFNYDTSLIDHPIISRIEQFSAMQKRTMFAGSPFHWGQIAFRGLQMGLSAHEIFNPPPITKDSLILREGVKYGGATIWGDRMNQRLWKEGVIAGSGLLHKLPGVGKALDWTEQALFDKYIPRLKAAAYEKIYHQLYSKHSDWSKEQLHRTTASIVNGAFGGLNWKLMGFNVASVQALRLAVLAPDFTGSEIVFASQGVRPGGSIVTHSLGKMVLFNYAVARLLNILVSGDPHLEAPFGVVLKNGNVISPRTMPGDIYHAATDPRGFINGRWNPLTIRLAYELMHGTNEYGRQLSAQQQVGELLKNFTPIPLQGVVPLEKNPEQGAANEALRSIGLQPHAERSPASQLAWRYAQEYSTTGPVDPKTIQRFVRDEQIENFVRQHNNSADYILKAVDSGQIPRTEGRNILKTIQETEGMSVPMAQLYSRAKRLPFKQFLGVWDAASNVERSKLMPIMNQKSKNYIKNMPKTESAPDMMQDPLYDFARRFLTTEEILDMMK